MRILIINPNSSKKMTAAILKAAENYADKELNIDCKWTEGAPPFIETYEDTLQAAPGMINLIREHEEQYDGFIIACHCDPNLDAMKEITAKPVVGIGEASMKMASMLGHRFTVISTGNHSVPNKEALIRKYHLQDLGSVWGPAEDMAACGDKEMTLQGARLALKTNQAEVIVLGCAGMAGLDKSIQEELEVPVLDGVICALIIVAGLVRYGVSTSKKRRYNPEY